MIKNAVHWFVSLPAGEVKKFLLIFYIVGLIGFVLPWTSALFIILTKWALLLNLGLLMRFHPFQANQRSLLVYIGIFVMGFMVELVGVNTGLIFGQYEYGDGLGIKFFNTPLLIGVNWLVLSYCWVAVLASVKIPAYVKALIGAGGMLVYDVVMEQSASVLDMWYWHSNMIPLQNYVAWFVIALAFQAVFYTFRVTHYNPLAKMVLVCQFLFFSGLIIVQLLTHS
jgi:putative membrane protein